MFAGARPAFLRLACKFVHSFQLTILHSGLPGLANALPSLNAATGRLDSGPDSMGLGAAPSGGGRGSDIFEQYRRAKSSVYATMEKAAKVTGCFRCGKDGHIAKNCPN